MPNTPNTLFISENDPRTAPRASPTAPPIIGIAPPEAAFAPFIASESADDERLPFIFTSPTNTVAVTDSVTVISFFTADVIFVRSIPPFNEEYILRQVITAIRGIIKVSVPFTAISAKVSTAELYAKEVIGCPLAEIIPVKTGM